MMSGRVKAIRLDEDLDRPLHRIFPLDRFEDLLRSGTMALVAPSLWIDPREDPLTTFVMVPEPSNGSERPGEEVARYLPACWAQCWSTEADSDVLLRAYSRVELENTGFRNLHEKEEGVRATTTPRRLLSAMKRWALDCPKDHFYLSSVTYEAEADFGAMLAERLRSHGPRHFSTPDGRAESLCAKRARFIDEREVRLICVGNARLDSGAELRLFSVDADALFYEIAFDPRLPHSEQGRRIERFRAAGFAGSMIEDAAYAPVINVIPMPSDWPAPPDWS